ncbi:MAG: aminoacyltransferase, partial [Bacteroidia bacterium]|nr:aminoacyltransferase [Bacteroidia bacterium]
MIKVIPAFQYNLSNDVHSSEFPVYYFESYSEFIKKTQGKDIILLHHTELNATAVFRIRKNQFWNFAQLIHAPLKFEKKLSVEEEAIYFKDAIAYLRDIFKIDKIEQGDVLGFTKFKPNNALHSKYGSYQIDLNQTPENILSNFNPKFARDVRHAEKQELTFKTGLNLLDDFYSVYNLTSKHTGMYTDSKEYFRDAMSVYGEKHCDFAVAYDRTIPIGALFMLKTQYKVCITHTGTDRNSNIHGAI